MTIRIAMSSTLASALLLWSCALPAPTAYGQPQQPTAAVANPSGGYVRGPASKRVIVFVNGVLGDGISTWTNSSGAYWPRLLVGDAQFNQADVYVHTFVSPPITTAQTIQELANRMQAYLIADDVIGSHDEIVFICHSMGGLVTRAFLVAQRLPPAKVPMIYFFATPTTGANIAEIPKLIGRNPQFRDMLPMRYDGYVSQLQDAWLQTSGDKALDYPDRVASYCAYEKKDVYGLVRVVEQASATNLCNRRTAGILADHIDIVKPADARSEPYIAFKAAYMTTFSPLGVQIAKALADESPVPPFGTQKEALAPDYHAKREAVDTKYFDVDCEQTKAAVVPIDLSVADGEEVVAVSARPSSISNLKSWSFAIASFEGKVAMLRYEIRGLDRTLLGLNCPGGGNAHVAINYVVNTSPKN